jgi:hypothetical protein
MGSLSRYEGQRPGRRIDCCMRMFRCEGSWGFQPIYTDAYHCNSLSLHIHTDRWQNFSRFRVFVAAHVLILHFVWPEMFANVLKRSCVVWCSTPA